MILFSTNPQNAGPKELECGKLLGTMRPACARMPTQLRSSYHDSVNVRPARRRQLGMLLAADHLAADLALGMGASVNGDVPIPANKLDCFGVGKHC